jgi:phosphatidylglycerophosphatase A
MPASGSVTVAVVGIPLYYLMSNWPAPLHALFLMFFTFASVWLHTVGDRLLGEKDSRKLVWDELVGFLIAVALVGAFTWPIALVAFVIERAIDIIKVPPAGWIERRWPGGWGVVGDDVVAGVYTCAILQVATLVAPELLGLSPT